MGEFFAMVEGLSPWWWLAFGLGLGAVEMITMSFFLIWPGLAALVMAGLVALMPQMPGEMRVLCFAVLAVLLTFVGRALMARFGDGGGASSTINARSSQLVGRKAIVLEWLGDEGAVEVDGIRWRAQGLTAETSTVGGAVEVVGADGMLLTVRAQTG